MKRRNLGIPIFLVNVIQQNNPEERTQKYNQNWNVVSKKMIKSDIFIETP